VSTLTEIEKAIEKLPASERTKLAQWWQEHFDPDEGLELRENVAAELDTARQEIARGDVADWERVKRPVKTTPL
jgi:hypothetical protein